MPGQKSALMSQVVERGNMQRAYSQVMRNRGAPGIDPDSDNHYIEPGNIKSTFNVAFGRVNLMKIGDFEQSSQYDDDICFFFGSQRIYLRRHIVRAFEEAKSKLAPVIGGHAFQPVVRRVRLLEKGA